MRNDSSKKRLSRVVGLQYDIGDGLPKVIIKGSGIHAEKIIDEGKRINRKSIIRDEKLLNQLYQLPMEGEIGSELFEVVAALLIHVYALDDKFKRGM